MNKINEIIKNITPEDLKKIKEMEWNGVIEESYSAADFRFHTELIEGPEMIKEIWPVFWKNKITYHQPDISFFSCTVHAAITNVSNIFWYKFSIDERKELWNLAKKNGAKEGVGWYTNSAVDLVRKRWNKKNKNRLVYSFMVEFNSNDFWKMLEKWYIGTWSFSGSRKYTLDKYDNCAIDTVTENNYGPIRYWHAINFVLGEDKKTLYVIDNYNKYKCNVYKLINYEQIEKYIHRYVYFYVPLLNITSKKFLENVFRRLVEQWYFNQKDKGIVYAWLNEVPANKRIFKDYLYSSATTIINKMLIDIAFVRKGL